MLGALSVPVGLSCDMKANMLSSFLFFVIAAHDGNARASGLDT